MAFAGSHPLLRIDLNMLRGNKIRTRSDFAEDGINRRYSPGDFVLAKAEEGDIYPAYVEWVDGDRLGLRLDLAQVQPVVSITATT